MRSVIVIINKRIYDDDVSGGSSHSHCLNLQEGTENKTKRTFNYPYTLSFSTNIKIYRPKITAKKYAQSKNLYCRIFNILGPNGLDKTP